MKKYLLTGSVTLISLILSVAVCLAAGEDITSSFIYLNNNLSVNIESSPLDYVLDQVERKTGVEFAFDRKESKNEISVKFISLPIEKAIQRMLNKFNYAIIYSSTGIRKVIIIGKRNEYSTTGSQANNILPAISSNTSDQQSNTSDIKNGNFPGGMVMTNLPGKMDGDELPEGMGITSLPEKTEDNKIPDGMVISNMPEKMDGKKLPDGMVITFKTKG
jgi:hypothetical protein